MQDRHTHTEEAKKEERRPKTETYSLAFKNSENYFSNQGANTLKYFSLKESAGGTRREGILKQRQLEK